MPHCNIVQIPAANRKRRVDKTIEFASIAGVKFIELHHRRGVGDQPIGVRGFQGGKVTFSGNKGGRNTYQFITDKEIDGREVAHGNALIFKPEELTNQLKAWIPDTPYNRNFMAISAFTPEKHKLYYIADPKIEKEVEELAVEKGYNKVKVDKTSQVIKAQSEKISEMEKELEELRKQKALKEETKEALDQTLEKEVDIEEACRKEVHSEEEEWINVEINKYLNSGRNRKEEGFYQSKKYKEYIIPKIESKILSKAK